MSLSLFLLVLGIWTIYRIYKSEMEKQQVSIIIDAWKEYEFRNESEDYKRALLKKSTFPKIAILSALGYILIITNYSLNFISGWQVLIVLGAIASYSTYLLGEVAFKPYNLTKLDEKSRFRVNENYQASRKTAAGILIGSLILGGNWMYQVEKNQNEEKLFGSNEATKIAGTGWCSEFWDIDVYATEDGYDANKSGGWPCINIKNVENIRFTEDMKMCFNYTLERTDGPPNNSNASSEYAYREYCSRGGAGGSSWSSSSFETAIWEKLKPELDELQVELCNAYYGYMSESERIVYC